MFENFPKAIVYIISNEFCERFNFYGLRAILSLYLSLKLNFDESSAVYIFHIFTSLVYLFPLIGAVLADGWLGKYRTIFYLSIVYALGGAFLSTGAIPSLGIPTKTFTWIGLLLIAVGTGGIKPCVSAFGGDQFKLPEQIKAFAVFFQLFYAAINAGSLLSTLITPVLRENVECFGEDDCYSLAFGVPALLMIVSIVIFVSGRQLYVMNEPTGRLNQTFKCIFYGAYKRIKVGKDDPKEHWLDYSVTKFGAQLVSEIKILFRILVLFIPMPMFWALYDQQGSRWTFQATRTDPRVGSLHIKPDQLQFLNPLLIIIFIPLFKYLIYPLLKRFDIRRPLQKMGIGGVLIMASFVVAGMIENEQFDKKLGPIVPGPDESHVILFNGYPCDYTYPLSDDEELTIRKYSKYTVTLNENAILNIEWIPIRAVENCETIRFSIKDTKAGAINNYLIRPATDEDPPGEETVVQRFEMDFQRHKSLMPDITILMANVTMAENMILKRGSVEVDVKFNNSRIVSNYELPKNGRYKILVNNETLVGEWVFDFAQNSVLMLGRNKDREPIIKQIVMVKPFTMSILVMIPQYILATAGEIMFSITGLEFSYAQAPRSMKSVLQACWLLTVAVGNLIVVLVTENRFFENPANESYLFGFLMLLDILLFVYLAKRYRPITTDYHYSDSELDYVGSDGKPKTAVPAKNVELQEREVQL